MVVSEVPIYCIALGSKESGSRKTAPQNPRGEENTPSASPTCCLSVAWSRLLPLAAWSADRDTAHSGVASSVAGSMAWMTRSAAGDVSTRGHSVQGSTQHHAASLGTAAPARAHPAPEAARRQMARRDGSLSAKPKTSFDFWTVTLLMQHRSPCRRWVSSSLAVPPPQTAWQSLPGALHCVKDGAEAGGRRLPGWPHSPHWTWATEPPLRCLCPTCKIVLPLAACRAKAWNGVYIRTPAP